MSKLKRDKVKYIRDYIKSDYKVRDHCYICGSKDNLELHHLYSLSELFTNWCEKNKLSISTVEEIMLLRVEFKKEHLDVLHNDNLFTLCKNHHQRLHNLYGQVYDNVHASKIRNWLEIQKSKCGIG